MKGFVQPIASEQNSPFDQSRKGTGRGKEIPKRDVYNAELHSNAILNETKNTPMTSQENNSTLNNIIKACQFDRLISSLSYIDDISCDVEEE